MFWIDFLTGFYVVTTKYVYFFWTQLDVNFNPVRFLYP